MAKKQLICVIMTKGSKR